MLIEEQTIFIYIYINDLFVYLFNINFIFLIVIVHVNLNMHRNIIAKNDHLNINKIQTVIPNYNIYIYIDHIYSQ